MKKTALSLTACAIIAGGFTGCGNAEDNEGAAPTRYNTTSYDQTGYNEDGANRRGEGPMTDMMTNDDRMPGQGTVRNRRPDNQGYRGQIGDRPGMVGERGTLNTRNMNDEDAGNAAGYNGTNNNGAAGDDMNNGNGNANGNSSNNGSGSGNTKKAKDIENKVENMEGVDDVRAIVQGKDVLVGIDTPEDKEQAKKLSDKIKSELESRLKNKNVHVTFDEEQFGNIQEIGNNLENGNGAKEAGDTIDDMIEDISNAAQRPFENS